LRKTINTGEVSQSIRDLTKVYKPSETEVDNFVRRFVRKYNITKGYEKELKQIVLNELKAMK